ncbi:MAG: TetR family transcriptional regulator [Actinomycetota bacterium]
MNKKLDEKFAALNGQMNRKQEEIIAASLELLTSGGLNELSLRDIAKKLNIKAPALYWYFKSKSELVDHMAEKILSKEFDGSKPRVEGESWQDWLAEYMGKLRKAMLAYPDGGRVVAGAHLYPTKTLAQVFENSIVSLTSAGVEELKAFYTAMTAVQFAFGFVIEEQSSPDDKTN